MRVNLHKRKVYGVRVKDVKIECLVCILCCEPNRFLFTYIGLPIGANMKLGRSWNPIVEKFKSKLSSWKATNLSFGGHLTLVSSVLSSPPPPPALTIFLFLKPRKRLLIVWRVLGEISFGMGKVIVKRSIAWLGIRWSCPREKEV